MSISNEMIYYAGLALIGFSVLGIAVATPILIITGISLKRRLESDYGKK
jgi:hypothetical protein